MLEGRTTHHLLTDQCPNQAWQEVNQIGSKILESSLKAIAYQITFPSPPQPEALPIIVFNPLNLQRSEVVVVPLLASSWQSGDDKIKCLTA